MQDFVYQVNQKSSEVAYSGESSLSLLFGHLWWSLNVPWFLEDNYLLQDAFLVYIVALKGELVFQKIYEIPSGILRWVFPLNLLLGEVWEAAFSIFIFVSLTSCCAFVNRCQAWIYLIQSSFQIEPIVDCSARYRVHYAELVRLWIFKFLKHRLLRFFWWYILLQINGFWLLQPRYRIRIDILTSSGDQRTSYLVSFRIFKLIWNALSFQNGAVLRRHFAFLETFDDFLYLLLSFKGLLFVDEIFLGFAILIRFDV